MSYSHLRARGKRTSLPYMHHVKSKPLAKATPVDKFIITFNSVCFTRLSDLDQSQRHHSPPPTPSFFSYLYISIFIGNNILRLGHRGVNITHRDTLHWLTGALAGAELNRMRVQVNRPRDAFLVFDNGVRGGWADQQGVETRIGRCPPPALRAFCDGLHTNRREKSGIQKRSNPFSS